MKQAQDETAFWRKNEELWSTVAVFEENGAAFSASTNPFVPRLGKVPDWMANRRPVSVRMLRIMMVLFFFSVGFVGASSLVGETKPSEFWGKMVIPSICVFNFLLGFFINQVWLVPKYFFNRRFKLFVLFNLLYTLVSLIARDISIWLFSGKGLMFLDFIKGDKIDHPVGLAVITVIIFLMITFIICLFNVLLRLGGINAQEEYVKSLKEKFLLQADFAFLKQQLSPHFLFNTLNNISALIDIDSKRAQKLMGKLSSVLRQILGEVKEKTVPLQMELDVLQKYSDLEKLRFGENVQFSLETHVENSAVQIAPLLMMPLVENAFKYGVHPSNPCRISISIEEKGGLLNCHVENTIVPKPTASQTKSGIGLENLVRRLNVCYPGRFKYETKKENGEYIADLQLDLNAASLAEE